MLKKYRRWRFIVVDIWIGKIRERSFYLAYRFLGFKFVDKWMMNFLESNKNIGFAKFVWLVNLILHVIVYFDFVVTLLFLFVFAFFFFHLLFSWLLTVIVCILYLLLDTSLLLHLMTINHVNKFYNNFVNTMS